MTAIVPGQQVGRSFDRVEGRDKVTGRARYTADNDIEGLVHAVMVQSEIAAWCHHPRVVGEQCGSRIGDAGRVVGADPVELPCAG